MEPPRQYFDSQDFSNNGAQNSWNGGYESGRSVQRKNETRMVPESSNIQQDVSTGGMQQPQARSSNSYAQYYDPSRFMADPVMNIAKAYGIQFAEQGKQQEWGVKYSHDQQPLPPRYDVNAPDLYIPVMAIITYIVIAGLVLGTQNRFSPEKLGIYASSALAWLIFENVVVLITKYVMNISQSMRVGDALAFSGYKFTCMNACLIAYLFMEKSVYYSVLAYCSLAIVFFLIRSVKGFVLENLAGSDGRIRKLYLLLFISLSQPFIIWWLTSSVTSYKAPMKLELPIDDEM